MARKNKPDPLEPTLVDDRVIDYWIANEIGGSGLSLSIQKTLRDMALELRVHRGPSTHQDITGESDA